MWKCNKKCKIIQRAIIIALKLCLMQVCAPIDEEECEVVTVPECKTVNDESCEVVYKSQEVHDCVTRAGLVCKNNTRVQCINIEETKCETQYETVTEDECNIVVDNECHKLENEVCKKFPEEVCKIVAAKETQKKCETIVREEVR